jgi:hypothetical protein
MLSGSEHEQRLEEIPGLRASQINDVWLAIFLPLRHYPLQEEGVGYADEIMAER